MSLSPPQSTKVHTNWNFNIFLAGQTLSTLGDSFAVIALPLLVLKATGSITQMGLVTGTVGAGQLVACVVSGLIVDRVDRRKLMFACDIARMLLYAALPLVFWLSGPAMWILYAVAALGGFVGNVHQVAGIAAVANLVDRARLAEANGRLQASCSLMYLIGPVLAGLTCSHFGPTTAIGVDAASFLVSAVTILFTRWRRSSTAQGALAAPESRLDQLLAGLRFLLKNRVLYSVGLVQTVFNFISAASRDLFVFHLKADLGQDDAAVGVVFGVASMGAITAGLAAPRLRRRFGFAACWLTAGFVQAIALGAVGKAPSVALIAALALVFIAMHTVRSINVITLRQELTPDHLIGRVSSTYLLVLTAPVPIGAALTSVLAGRYGVSRVLVGLGVAGVVLAFLALLTPVRTYRDAAVSPSPSPRG